MDRKQKINLLKDAFEGSGGQLRQLHYQRKKENMPVQELYGVINIRNCPASMLDIQVIATDDLIDGDSTNWMPLRECLQRFEKTGYCLPAYRYRADGGIDGNDARFDEVILEKLCLRPQKGNWRCLPHKTIADLRHYFKMSAWSLEMKQVILWFECAPTTPAQDTPAIL
jgi:hypothetical protein